MKNRTQEMIDWIESVEDRTRLQETQLMTIWQMKFVEKKRIPEISRKLNLSLGRLYVLFATDEQRKSR